MSANDPSGPTRRRIEQCPLHRNWRPQPQLGLPALYGRGNGPRNQAARKPDFTRPLPITSDNTHFVKSETRPVNELRRFVINHNRRCGVCYNGYG